MALTEAEFRDVLMTANARDRSAIVQTYSELTGWLRGDPLALVADLSLYPATARTEPSSLFVLRLLAVCALPRFAGVTPPTPPLAGAVDRLANLAARWFQCRLEPIVRSVHHELMQSKFRVFLPELATLSPEAIRRRVHLEADEARSLAVQCLVVQMDLATWDDARGPFFPYVRRRVDWILRDALRKVRRSEETLVRVVSQKDRCDLSPAEPALDRLDVAAWAATLNERERNAMYMWFFLGCTATEIADRIGAPRGTVDPLIHERLPRMIKNFFTRIWFRRRPSGDERKK